MNHLKGQCLCVLTCVHFPGLSVLHFSSLTIYSTLLTAPNPPRAKPSHRNKTLSKELRVSQESQESQPCI